MGIFKLNGIDYMGGGGGGNTNYEELTQLEYDALTEEEKNNGTIYFITDANSNQDGKFQPVIYSEEEREIGIWTDGKPLYQRTYIFMTGSSSGWTAYNHNIENMETPVSATGYVYGGSSAIEGVAYSVGTNAVGSLSIALSPTEISVYLSSTYFTNKQAIVTIQYTKTTDSPGSGQWTPQGIPAHHYSTEEQIVGTWVDGNTLYEKSFTLASQINVNSEWGSIGYSVPNINIITSCEVIRVGSRGTWPLQSSTNTTTGDIRLSAYGMANIDLGAGSIVTIRYTKTTS